MAPETPPPHRRENAVFRRLPLHVMSHHEGLTPGRRKLTLWEEGKSNWPFVAGVGLCVGFWILLALWVFG